MKLNISFSLNLHFKTEHHKKPTKTLSRTTFADCLL